MPNYTYKAKRGPKEVVEGELNAESEDAALSKITSMGLIPISLQEKSGMSTPSASIASPSPSASSSGKEKKAPAGKPQPKIGQLGAREKIRISHKDLNIFTRQFAILLKASVPLLKSFQILQAQTEDVKFKAVLMDMVDDLKEGGSLSEALAKYPRIFSQVYCSLIHSGEVSGTLDKVLVRLADFAEQEAEVRSKVKSAMVYPAFLAFVGVGTVFVLLTFVLPRLMIVFGDLGTELPTVTKVVMGASEFCQAYWMWMVGIVGVVIVWLRSVGLSEGQQKILDGCVLGLPVFGKLTIKSEISKFLRSIELLYENGIPLYQAVDVGMRTISNLVLKNEMMKVPPLLEEGATLAASLGEVNFVSDFVTNMVAVGEESGQLGSAVGETASFYEQETNQFIKVATSLVEPFMILSIGLVVGFIVIAMLLPIFEIHVLAS